MRATTTGLMLALTGCVPSSGIPKVSYVMDITSLQRGDLSALTMNKGCQARVFGHPLDPSVSVWTLAEEASIVDVRWMETQAESFGPYVKECVTIYGSTAAAPATASRHGE